MENKFYYKIAEKKKIKELFLLCFLVYFTTYLGRLNYTAALSEIIVDGSLTKEQAGLIGTVFFFAYGVGQFISGFLGDKLSPKWMVFSGMAFSGSLNLLMFGSSKPEIMALLWGANGFVQAFIWSPMIRMLYEYLHTKERIRYCTLLNSSVPLGTMAAYGMTAGIIFFFHWKWVFESAGFILIAVSFIWLIGITKLETHTHQYGEKEPVPVFAPDINIKKKGVCPILCSSGLVFILIVLVIQGALKDGVTTWVPTYMNETYQLGSILSILGTMIIPVFNLLGVYLAGAVNEKLFHNELVTSGIFFLFCGVSLVMLWMCSGTSVIISFVLLIISTTSMMAVNTMLIAILPSYFGVMGKAASVSGVLNSSVYMGGACSTYGIGAISNLFGWKTTIMGWTIMAAIACALCILFARKWSTYRKKQLNV